REFPVLALPFSPPPDASKLFGLRLDIFAMISSMPYRKIVFPRHNSRSEQKGGFRARHILEGRISLSLPCLLVLGILFFSTPGILRAQSAPMRRLMRQHPSVPH